MDNFLWWSLGALVGVSVVALYIAVWHLFETWKVLNEAAPFGRRVDLEHDDE